MVYIIPGLLKVQDYDISTRAGPLQSPVDDAYPELFQIFYELGAHTVLSRLGLGTDINSRIPSPTPVFYTDFPRLNWNEKKKKKKKKGAHM